MTERGRSTAELLGYPPDARLLIINADDFGMAHAENVATMAGLAQAAFCSATIMTPCPWFEEAVDFAQRLPGADLGVHITHTSEWQLYKWGPVAGSRAVPSLVDAHANFFATVEELYAHARLEEIEIETRAQIERALAAGIDVTHLDSHMGTVQLDVNYHALYVRLAAEYRLPIRMARRSWMRDMGMAQIVELVDRLGVLTPDCFWYGGPREPETTVLYWTELLHKLEPGINELYVHPAVDEPEIRAIMPGWRQRVADFNFFTAPETRGLLAGLGITLIGYRALRDAQRRLQTC